MMDQNLINFANFLADESAKIAKKYFRLPNGEEAKLDDTPVTKADREIELMIRNHIQKNYPNHGIIGEEYGNINEDSEFVWVIDPIDGTSSFIIGRPIFGTLIALTYNKKPILGIINQPISHERWLGIKGQGAWFIDNSSQQAAFDSNFSQPNQASAQSRFNSDLPQQALLSANSRQTVGDAQSRFNSDLPQQALLSANSRQTVGDAQSRFNKGDLKEFFSHRIITRQVTEIKDAVMCSSSPFYFQNEDRKILENLTKLTKYQNIGGIVYGGDCYSFACLAMGLIDIIIEPGLKCYDYAATQIIIQEAGGVITDWQGNDLNLRSNVRVLACANFELHKKVLQIIKNFSYR